MSGPHISHVVHYTDSFNQEGICARCEQTGAALDSPCPGQPPVRHTQYRFPKRYELTPGEVDVILDALLAYSESYRLRLKEEPMAPKKSLRILDRLQTISDINNKFSS